MLLGAAKLVLENLVLHVRLMQAQGVVFDGSCEALSASARSAGFVGRLQSDLSVLPGGLPNSLPS